ncbi:hypothetical protein [Flavobacterium sp. 9]|nr:hypothetical protein [Flavobacterium sp. 9]
MKEYFDYCAGEYLLFDQLIEKAQANDKCFDTGFNFGILMP